MYVRLLNIRFPEMTNRQHDRQSLLPKSIGTELFSPHQKKSLWAFISVPVALFVRCHAYAYAGGTTNIPTTTPQAVDQGRATAPTTWVGVGGSGPGENRLNRSDGKACFCDFSSAAGLQLLVLIWATFAPPLMVNGRMVCSHVWKSTNERKKTI